MDEYINREAAAKAVKDYAHMVIDKGRKSLDTVDDTLNIVARIEKIPAADVAPVAHGRWIEKTVPEGCRYFECSNCGAHENRHTAIKGYYCWRCGAKMDGGEDNG